MAGRNLSIIEKIPKLEDIAPVYAVIVMMIYPLALAWETSSCFIFLRRGDCSLFAYMMAVNLIESLGSTCASLY
jgi:hypothetical protein